MILVLLRLLLLLFSLYGYGALFSQKCRFPESLSAISACCLVILLLYAGAFARILNGTVWGVFGIGLALGIFFLFIQQNPIEWEKLLSLKAFWMTFYFFIFSWTLLHTRLEHYDNYSHWALIVKFLFTEGRLPGAADSLIHFSSYPMGSSLFLYYAAKVVGFQDGILLTAQFLLIFAGLYALFAAVRDESLSLVRAMMFATFALFNYFNIAIRMDNLLVDFILPILTLAGIAGVYRLRKEQWKRNLFAFLLLSVLLLVKNSAVFFAVIFIGYYLAASFGVNIPGKIKNGLGVLLTLVLSFVPLTLWKAHVAKTFTEEVSKTVLSSFGQFQKAFEIPEAREVTRLFLDQIRTFSNVSLQGFLLINLLLIGTMLFVSRQNKRRGWCVFGNLAAIDSMIVLYYAGMYGMYLFSMPIDEALYLAGFERYASSIIIWGLGMGALVLAREIDLSMFEQTIEKRTYKSYKNLRNKKAFQYTSVFLLFFSVLLLLSEINGIRYHESHFEQTIPAKFMRVTGNKMQLNDRRYLVVTTDKLHVDDYYVQYVGRYFLYSPHVDGRENFLMDDETFINLLSRYDEVVVLDDHYTFDAMMSKLFNETLTPGVYKVSDLLSGLAVN